MKRPLVQYYYLSPMHVDSNRVLEVLNFHTHDRAALGLGYLRPGNANQLWCFIPCGDGFYEVMNKHSLCVLDDKHMSKNSGGEVYQFSRHGGPNQQWRIKQAGQDNQIQIIPKCRTNYALDVEGHNKAHNAKMVVYCDWKGPNQTWRLIPA